MPHVDLRKTNVDLRKSNVDLRKEKINAWSLHGSARLVYSPTRLNFASSQVFLMKY